jgi:amidohydrolase
MAAAPSVSSVPSNSAASGAAGSALRQAIERELPELRAIRHELHRHPEIAFTEHRTSSVIQRELTKLGISFVAGLAKGPRTPEGEPGTGVVGYLPATEPGGESQPAVGLRADIDALPIEEQTGLPHASTIAGRMHACGHDGHTTVLLGAARVLKNMKRPRPVTFVFQPAEEGGGGGELLCKQGLMDGKIIGPRIATMYGLHGWPELPVGTLGSRPGPLLASTDEVRVIIHGRQSHAAYPQYSSDSVLCVAHCITALQQIASRNVSPLDSVVLSICILKAGTARNVLPETAEFVGTLRTLKAETREFARRRITEICTAVAASFSCRAEVKLEPGYPVTYNDPALTEKWFQTARETFGAGNIVTVENPVMGGEDFSYYGQHAPAVFYCLGLRPAGRDTYPTLHQPTFDFNDDALPVGIEAMVTLATQ